MDTMSEVDWMFDIDQCDAMEQNDTVNDTVFSGAIPTDDIWNKYDFGIENGCENSGDGIFEPSTNILSSSVELFWKPKKTLKEIRHHDCMWAGLCGSKDHKNADNCILAYEDLKPAPIIQLNIKSEPQEIYDLPFSLKSNASNNELNTIARTTLNNGTQITTVFKNRTSNNCNNSSGNVLNNLSHVGVGKASDNVVKVSIIDKKSTRSTLASDSSRIGNNLTYFKHLSTSNDSLSNDPTDIHLMPISEVTGQITRILSTIETNPPTVDYDCANRDHNYGMTAPSTIFNKAPVSISSSPNKYIKVEEVHIKQESLMTSDEDDDEECHDYSHKLGSDDGFMSPPSSIAGANVAKFDYGVQQIMSKSKYIKTEDLGVQTPSDSDEEVDVVSLYDADLYETCKKTLITPPHSVLTSRSTTPNIHSQQNSVSKLMSSSHQNYSINQRSNAAKRLIKSTLPTNPYDNIHNTYEELQRNVAKVIKKSTHGKSSSKKQSKKQSKKKSKKSIASGTTYLNKTNQSKSKATTTFAKRKDYEDYKKQYIADLRNKMSVDKQQKKKQYRIDLLPEKRKFHNNMERKRRVDLRNLFEDLRELIPNLQNKKRAPKVQILNEAEKLCIDLARKSNVQSRQAEELRREQMRLRAAVAPLRYLFYEQNISSMN